jgi:DNA replication and repair protein RecF
MFINNLSLNNFRNYEKQEVIFTNGINILVGSNGQGKTNVLEGIYYLLTGKSYRVSHESELIHWGQKNFYLKANFLAYGRKYCLESYYEKGKKAIKINNVACQKLSEYVGMINVVFFTPDDLNIIKSGPLERRRFIDLLIAQIKPSHIALLNTYIRIIKQKNNLLKSRSNKTDINDQLAIWNEQLIEVGTKIIENRFDIAEKLQTQCSQMFSQVFGCQEDMDLQYISLGKRGLKETLAYFPEALEKYREAEIEKRAVLVGPHRDDIIISINGRLARYYASQGQQRSLVLCLKLAEMEIINSKKEEYPILLLDDVLSELDENRRQYLMEYIISSSIQTMITATDLSQAEKQKEGSIYRVKQGTIRRES